MFWASSTLYPAFSSLFSCFLSFFLASSSMELDVAGSLSLWYWDLLSFRAEVLAIPSGCVFHPPRKGRTMTARGWSCLLFMAQLTTLPCWWWFHLHENSACQVFRHFASFGRMKVAVSSVELGSLLMAMSGSLFEWKTEMNKPCPKRTKLAACLFGHMFVRFKTNQLKWRKIHMFAVNFISIHDYFTGYSSEVWKCVYENRSGLQKKR